MREVDAIASNVQLLVLITASLWGQPVEAVPSDSSATTESSEEQASGLRLRFGIVYAGYQGSFTTQRFSDPAGASIQVNRHGGELIGGGLDAVVSSKGPVTRFHTAWGRAGFLFGGTPPPIANTLASDKTIPRHGFNFGLVSDFRENAGIAIGGACGAAFSGIASESIKAYTRSTVPGNHLELDLGVAGGLHCGRGPTFFLLQYAIEGNLGVEQVQDLAHQQGNRTYSPERGNALLLYGAHGPIVLLVHDSRYLHAALSGSWIRSIGQGRFGGQRWSLGGQLSLAFGGENAFGFAPWYRLDVIDYGPRSKVTDLNERRGHAFGISFIAVLGRP